MAIVGSTSRRDEADAAAKVAALVAMGDYGPDVISDVSVRGAARPLWQRVIESGGAAAATLPVYLAHDRHGHIDTHRLLEIATEHVEGGVGVLTIHPTPRRDLVRLAQERMVPWTSRGGGLVIADLLASGRAENAYERILPDLIDLVRRHSAVLSIGASFRSATIFDSADPCQMLEIARQIRLADELRAEGVSVIIESPGHARPRDIETIAHALAPAGYPVMPLGPIPTDAAIGVDHIAAAIGAVIFGRLGCASVIAAVTREEHTGGVPTIESTVEAVMAARTAAHVVDLDRFGDDRADREVAVDRASHRTCVVGRTVPGCSRCGHTCPLH